MSTQPSAAAVNAGSTTPFPHQHTLTLTLILEVPGQEQLEYLSAPDTSVQLGFIADLFDLLTFEMELPVQSINGVTHAQVRQFFQSTL